MPDRPVRFSPEYIRQIRDMLEKDAPVVCPRCGAGLTSGRPIAGDGTEGSVWRLNCRRCNRTPVLPGV